MRQTDMSSTFDDNGANTDYPQIYTKSFFYLWLNLSMGIYSFSFTYHIFIVSKGGINHEM